MPIISEELIARGRLIREESIRLRNMIANAHPAVRRAKRFTQGKPKGAVSIETRYLRDQRRAGETAEQLWNRLRKLGASDGQPVYFDGDEMVIARSLDGKTKTISRKAFERRLVGTKAPKKKPA